MLQLPSNVLEFKRCMGITTLRLVSISIKRKKQKGRAAMSNVQLSASRSETLRGTFPERARRNVCRSLFGPVDHGELNRDIEAKLREVSERDQKRWNFNFASGTPLHGDYEWEGAALEAMPAFYRETVQVGKRRAAAGVQDMPNTEAPNRENSAWDEAARAPDSSGRASTSTRAASCARRRRRRKRRAGAPFSATSSTSRITDFYTKRRKQAGDLKSPRRFTSLSNEQTPRKRLR